MTEEQKPTTETPRCDDCEWHGCGRLEGGCGCKCHQPAVVPSTPAQETPRHEYCMSRDKVADLLVKASGKTVHANDCATSVAPAEEPGVCDCDTSPVSPQEGARELAEKFHESYERLAPQFGYKTRESSAKPWAEVPENNRALMTAVCKEILDSFSASLKRAEERVEKAEALLETEIDFQKRALDAEAKLQTAEDEIAGLIIEKREHDAEIAELRKGGGK